MKTGDMLKVAVERLSGAGIPGARLDAEVLVAHVLGVERYRLVTNADDPLTEEQVKTCNEYISRRLSFEPVAYITGTKEFYSLDFHVTPSVLIPRPETELLVDMAIYYAPRGGRVLDLCTGSGAIAVALAHSRADLEITATDISHGAIEVAKGNAAGIIGPDRIEFIEGDLFGPLQGRTFSLIVSNPPYVNPEKKFSLQKDLMYEPEQALFAEKKGTAVIERILSGAGKFLEPGGMLILEIGEDMKDYILRTGRDAKYDVSTLNDYSGLPRVAILKS